MLATPVTTSLRIWVGDHGSASTLPQSLHETGYCGDGEHYQAQRPRPVGIYPQTEQRRNQPQRGAPLTAEALENVVQSVTR